MCGGVELFRVILEKPAGEGAAKHDDHSVLAEVACVNLEPVSIRQLERVLRKWCEVEDQAVILVRRSSKGTQVCAHLPHGINMKVVLE